MTDINFEQGAVIEGKTVESTAKSDQNASFDMAKKFQEKWEKVYEPMFNTMVNEFILRKGEQRGISYFNNLNINLHSHNLPAPIPMGMYITSFQWGNTLNDPYNQCSMRLKMPLSIATELFADEHGKMSPGQYIYISSAPASIGKVKSPHTPKDAWDLPFAKGMFLGCITDINWTMSTDNTGNIIQVIDVEANSFIHALQMGQYFISPLDIVDQNKPQISASIQGTLRDLIGRVEGTTISSSPFALSLNDWNKITEVLLSMATKGFKGKEVVSTTVGEDFSFKETKVGSYEKALLDAGFRMDIQGSMQYLLKLLGYPLLPATLKMEPFDTNSWLELFYTSDLSVNQLLTMFYKQSSEEEFVKLCKKLADFIRTVGQGSVLFTGDEALDRAATFLMKDVEEALAAENAAATGALSLGATRIGDVIRVATYSDDLPPSCSLRATMPREPLQINALESIKNANELSTTIWSLFKGTFHFDEEMYELYPILVPIHNADLYQATKSGESEVPWNLRDKLHPLHNQMKCIPYIIFRQKPMFPGVSISQEENAKKVLEFNYNLLVNKPYKLPTYITDSELAGTNQEGKQHGLAGLLPYVVHQDEIISMSCQLSDYKRLNGVRIKSPFSQKQSQVNQTFSIADPVIDVQDAVRNGLRMYKGTYPLVGLEDDMTRELLGSYAERYFTTYGYENNMPQGALVCKYRNNMDVLPGQFLAINVSGTEYPAGADTRVYPNGTPVDEKAFNDYYTFIRNTFVVYVNDVQNSLEVDGVGNVIASTTIMFERGVFGYQHPILPYYKAATTDPYNALNESDEEKAATSTVRKDTQTLLQTVGNLKRRKDDASPVSATAGQPSTQADIKRISGIDIFEDGYTSTRRETALRMLSRGIIDKARYDAIIQSIDVPDDTYDYYDDMISQGLILEDEAALALRKEEFSQRVALYLQGQWINQETHDALLVLIANLVDVDAPSPIPKALRKAFHKAMRAQGTAELDGSITVEEEPAAPLSWDADQIVIPDAKYR